MFVLLSAAVGRERCKSEALEQSIDFIGYFYSAEYWISFIAQRLFSDPKVVHQI